MMNPMMIMQMLKSGGNPQAMVMQMLQQQSANNPIANNAMQMLKNGDMKGIEQLARNLCKEKGINPDEALKQIMGGSMK